MASANPAPRRTDASHDLGAVVEAVVREAAKVADRFEVRAELLQNRKCAFDNGVVNAYTLNRLGGICVKVHVAGGSGFGASHDSSAESARRLVETAVRMARANSARGGRDFPFLPGDGRRTTYAPAVSLHPSGAALEDFTALLKRSHTAAVAAAPDARIASAIGAQDRRVIRADSAGTWTDTSFLLSTLLVHAAHRAAGRLGDGFAWQSGERGLLDFEDQGGPEALGRAAASNALEMARAQRAPAGHVRVLCDNHLAGLLAHESFGHLTEYDLVSMGWSVLKGRLGQTFASENVSIVDAPEVPGAPRSGVRLPIDEEGTRGAPVRILDRGVLSSYLHLRGSSGEFEEKPKGNGRALSVRHPPIVRMRNTYFEPGDMRLEDALRELGDGVYLLGGRGGAPANDGSFMFTAIRGYRVRAGAIEAPIRSCSIAGNILASLAGIEGATRDFEVASSWFGGCGKWDQSFLPVGMGGPHILLSDALLGGDAR